jgi:acyl-CoA dehydrogenase
MTTDPLLLETTERLFAATCTFEAVQQAEKQGWADGVWAAAAAMGLPWIGVAEEAGGSGGSLGDALAVLRLAGRYAAPIPLAETGVLGGWLLAGAGLTIPEAPVTVVPGLRADTLSISGDALSGVANRVPWARSVHQAVALVNFKGRWMVAVVPLQAAIVEPGTNLAGEPRDTVAFDGVTVSDCRPAAESVDPDALRYRGALSRIMLMAGALDQMSELTLRYGDQRQQFGRPVAAFQAVQAHLVRGAQDAALVSMAAQAAGAAAERGDGRFEIASAKILAGEAATSATRGAHQAHGAMGMTQEYLLHHFSRRLWSWRSEYGDSRWWAAKLGTAIAGAGADLLYPLITAGSSLGCRSETAP